VKNKRQTLHFALMWSWVVGTLVLFAIITVPFIAIQQYWFADNRSATFILAILWLSAFWSGMWGFTYRLTEIYKKKLRGLDQHE